ncbi:MAG: hypothetical protein F4Z25_00035 [Chloroflexi bacterium]|nr:hypothetical protein [Chloroflexota bacterium]
MANSRTSGGAATRDLQRLLAAYLDGRAGIEDVLAWEADLSLDAEVAGSLRTSLDRLSLVAAEVCDGARAESEFRSLALEVVEAELAQPSLAVAEAAPPYRSGGAPE